MIYAHIILYNVICMITPRFYNLLVYDHHRECEVRVKLRADQLVIHYLCHCYAKLFRNVGTYDTLIK